MPILLLFRRWGSYTVGNSVEHLLNKLTELTIYANLGSFLSLFIIDPLDKLPGKEN